MNEEEVYGLADEALAHLHTIRDEPTSDVVAVHGPKIEKNLELIRRRTDPAVGRNDE